jgi:hypothetical protein
MTGTLSAGPTVDRAPTMHTSERAVNEQKPAIELRPTSPRSAFMTARLTLLAALAAALQLAACGGGSSSSASTSTSTASVVKGVATAKSVSVVTAN